MSQDSHLHLEGSLASRTAQNFVTHNIERTRRPKPSRRVLLLLLLIALSLCGLLPACVPSYSLNALDPNDPANEAAWVGPMMPNARLELAGKPTCCETGGPCGVTDQVLCDHLSFAPSRTLWVRAGDQLIARWDEFKISWHFVDGENQTCSYCVSPNHCRVSTLGFSPPENTDPLVVAYEGFISENTPTLIARVGWNKGCPNPLNPPRPAFPVAGSGTYQIVAPIFASNRCTDGSYNCDPNDLKLRAPRGEPKKVFVVGDSPQITTYQMDRRVEPANPGIVWYGWSTASDPVWNDAFSSNVRITKVRILKGLPSLDSTTGRYALGGATVVRPSRIVLVTADLTGGQSILAGGNDALRCFADGSQDGNINLAQCRRACPTCPHSTDMDLEDATPSYSKLDPTTHLTWFAEFNPCEGCGGPPCGSCSTGATEPSLLAPGEVLAIEFTIEKV